MDVTASYSGRSRGAVGWVWSYYLQLEQLHAFTQRSAAQSSQLDVQSYYESLASVGLGASSGVATSQNFIN